MIILFVCTGNTCRSPLAMFLLRNLLAEFQVGSEKCQVMSAGLAANPGQPMSQAAVDCLPESDQPQARAYAARQLDAGLLSAADWVLCMTNEQASWLKKAAADMAGKILSLGQAAAICCDRLTDSGKFPQESGPVTDCGLYDRDIPDPYGGSAELYQRTARLIRQDLQPIAAYLAAYGKLSLA
ncbi:hypothetical protein HCH52_11235 [Oscillospiraceae bacterium HV4-5-C5C]|nr:hypothetical protein [Oscillospiraceae bacterium HV4-5-C5C]